MNGSEPLLFQRLLIECDLGQSEAIERAKGIHATREMYAFL